MKSELGQKKFQNFSSSKVKGILVCQKSVCRIRYNKGYARIVKIHVLKRFFTSNLTIFSVQNYTVGYRNFNWGIVNVVFVPCFRDNFCLKSSR